MNMTLSVIRAPLLVLLVAAVAFAGCTSEKGPNVAPKADLAVKQEGEKVIVLDGTKSADPNGDKLSYHWNWVLGNATTAEPKIQVEFPDAVVKGNAGFVASLVVRDGAGKASVAYGAIQFGTGADNVPVVAVVPSARWVKPNTEVTIDASVSTDKDKDALNYEWIWGPRGTFDSKATGVADPCAEADKRLATFSTGCLNEGQKFDLVFDQAGTFNIHCHPHPWMRGRIVVDESLPAAKAEHAIANFGYDPAVLRVGLGSTVTFVNKDPVPHTATVFDWVPGSKDGGKAAVFRATPAEGEYVARLVINDGKGGIATQSFGIKVSADAPENPFSKTWNSAQPLAPSAVPGQTWQSPSYDTTFDGILTAKLSWPDQTTTGSISANFSVGRVDPDGAFTKQPQCVAKMETALASEPPARKMVCPIIKDNYVFRVDAVNGANPSVVPEWQLTATTILHSKPGFGDSGGDGHAHAH